MATFKDKLQDKLLSFIPDGRIRVEAAMRSNEKKVIPSGDIKRSNVLFTAMNVKKWKDAVVVATDPNDPDFLLLAELYDNLKLDAHYMSVVESRVYRVLRSKYKITNDAGVEVPEVKYLFERPWFEQFLQAAMLSKFDGVKVIELFDMNADLELNKVTVIPMQHTKPHKGLVLYEPGSDKGYSYKEEFEKYYIQIGENGELGLLRDLAPLILAKKMSFGSWLDWIEKFGIAPRYVTTDNMTTERQNELYDMMMSMISNHVAVLQGNEKVEIGDIPATDTYKVFDEFIKRVNSEISKRILGQDGTSDNKDASGTYGSIKVLQEVANDRHESDKLFAQYIINKVLIPKIVALSSTYAPLANLTFDWDESEDMDNGTLIDKAVALTNAGFIIDHEQLALKTGIPIIGMKEGVTPPADEKGNGEGAVKKK